jgi:hypothetical protein
LLWRIWWIRRRIWPIWRWPFRRSRWPFVWRIWKIKNKCHEFAPEYILFVFSSNMECHSSYEWINSKNSHERPHPIINLLITCHNLIKSLRLLTRFFKLFTLIPYSHFAKIPRLPWSVIGTVNFVPNSLPFRR